MSFVKNKLKSLNKKFYPNKLFYDPEWIVLGVNNICNLHCKMCDVGIEYTASNFYQNLMGSTPLNMPLDLIKIIYDQSSKYYPKVKIGYAFTEPLIYPHLIDSLQYAKQKKLYTTITTNALTLKQKAKDLCASSLKEIYISLDGPQEIHNQIRGHKSSFQKAIEGIEELHRYKNPPAVSIFCVITEWNIGYLKEFVDFFSNYNLKQLGFMHTNFTPQFITDEHNKIYGDTYPATVSNTEQISLDKMNLNELLKDILAIKSSRYKFPVTFSPEISDQKMLDVFYNQPERLIGKNCSDVFRNIMIKSDGTVIPAHGRCYNINVGSIYNQSLPEIWNSSTFSKFREDLINAGGLFPACSRCCSAF